MNWFLYDSDLLHERVQQKLSNSLRLKFCYLKIFCFPHPRYHPQIIGHILRNVQKMCVCFNEIIMINYNEKEN